MAEDITTSEFISKLSVNSLPDNPAAHGWKAAQIKEKFFGPIYEGLKRLLKEIQQIDPSAGGGTETGDGCSCEITEERVQELIDEALKDIDADCSCEITEERVQALINEALKGISGGSGVNIVQKTGTSETDVMSQKATTDAIINAIYPPGGGGSSGGEIARRVPFQKFYATKDTQSYDYTVHDFGENRFAARIFVDSGMQQCNSIMKLSFTPTNLPVIIHPYSNIIVETNPCVLTDFDYSTYQNILKHITPQVEFNYCYDQPGYYDGSFQVSWLIDEYDTYYYSQSFDFIVELEIEYDYTDEYASVLFIRITPVNW